MLRCDQTRSSDIRINIRISWIYSCSSFFSWPASLGSTLMSASKLPFEILSQVAEYLSFRDWWSCSLVCKAWHEPFNQCVWSIVEINTKSQLEHASFDSLEPQNPYRKNSFFVKNIYIFWGLLLNDDQLNGIQKQFPNVKSLELQVPRYFSYVFNKNLFQYTNWRPWMSVKNLNITVPVHDITYGDMETLHTYFPSLEYLKISATFGNFQLIDPHILQSIQPATSLINVHLEVFDIDIQWLVYFAYKFTHVRTLTWSNHGECKMARVNYFVAKDVIQGLPYIFPRLENLYMLRSEYKNWAYYTLLLVASTSGSSLRCIRDRLRNDSKEDRFRPALGNSLKSYPDSVVSLTVENSCFYQNTLIIPAELGLCSRLAHLCLILPTMWLKLDTVLDHCEMLKILIVHVSKVSLRVQEYECMVGHDLRLIKIAAEEADVKVFRYLSHRCRNLKYVSLFGIKLVNVFGPISQDVLFDMRFSHLKYFELNKVTFYSNKDIMSSETAIHLIQSAFAGNSRTQLISGSSDRLDSPSRVPGFEGSHILHTWHQMYFDWSQTYPVYDVRILTQSEASQAETLFSQPSMVQNSAKLAEKHERNLTADGSEDDWENVLLAGYVKLILGSAEQCNISTCTSDDFKKWKRIYEDELSLWV